MISVAGRAVELRRSDRRKTIGIEVSREGEVIVRAPVGTPERNISDVIARREPWIAKSLAEWKALNAHAPQMRFESGESIWFLGKPYPLEIVEEQRASLTFDGSKFTLREDMRHAAEMHFRRFFRQQGTRLLPDRLNELSRLAGEGPTGLRILDLGGRWGSCSSKGVINLHWKALMAPWMCVDYLLAHEIAHLKFKDHSQAFWREVEKTMPEYRKAEKWLRENGARLGL